MDAIEDFSEISLGNNYEIIPYEDSLKLEEYLHVAHCGIYSRSSHLIEHQQYLTKAAVMMVFRMDGMIGFPGGCIDKGENILEGLKRELKEEINLDISQRTLDDPRYVNTFKYDEDKQCCHLYSLEVTLEDFEQIEKDILNAKDYGFETFGLLRVPLFTMKDGRNGLPSFLCNHFIADSKDQLFTLLVSTEIMSLSEIVEAVNTYKCMQRSCP